MLSTGREGEFFDFKELCPSLDVDGYLKPVYTMQPVVIPDVQVGRRRSVGRLQRARALSPVYTMQPVVIPVVQPL